jgi:serine/threonine protein phosphatase PrpC
MFRTFGISLRGKSHIKSETANQDCFSCGENGKFVVVSDGVGSAELSQIGSQLVCKAVEEISKKEANNIDGFIEEVHTQWCEYINKDMANKFSATCLFCVKADNKMLIGQLGDGIIAVLSEDENKDFICEDNKQDSFANSTAAMSVALNLKQWKRYNISQNDIKAVILCTDGVSDSLKDDRKLTFFRELCKTYKEYSSEETIEDIKEWLEEWRSDSGDDKTIAFMFKEV